MESAVPDVPDTPAQDSAAILADAVRAALGATYARPIVIETGDGVVVLAGKPFELARTAIAVTHGFAAADRIGVLDVEALPWNAVPEPGLTLWRQYARSGGDGEVVTKIVHGDPPVQVVVADGGWLLLRTADGAQGWIDGEQIALEGAPAPDHDAADGSRVDPETFVAEVLAFDGVPYVWGGTTMEGVDCSGLVQRAAWRAGSCWLPRHSRALLTVGSRVAPSAIVRGDVLVLQRDPKTYEQEQRAQLEALAATERQAGAVPAHGPAIHPMHVAIALSPDEVVHASRDAMRVTREPLAALRERYRVLGVRRFGPEPTT